MTINDADDAAVLARWDQLHRPPIPIGLNEQGLIWKTVTDLPVYLSMLQDAKERRQVVAWVLARETMDR